MTVIYGVDTEKPYSASDVRDAIIECFAMAHREQLEELREFAPKGTTDIEFENLKRIDVRQMVRSTMKSAGGDYDVPTKNDLTATLEKLKDFAKNFRNQEIIARHYSEILTLLNGLK